MNVPHKDSLHSMRKIAFTFQTGAGQLSRYSDGLGLDGRGFIPDEVTSTASYTDSSIFFSN
jgi:hypothetical protein